MEAKLKHEHRWPSALLKGLQPGRGGAGQCWGPGPEPERAEASPGPSQLVTPALAAWGKEQGQTHLVPACRHATQVCVCICTTVCVLLMYVCECVCAFVHTSMHVACVYVRECACVFAWVCVCICTSVCMCVCTCVCVSPRCAVLGSPYQPVPLLRCMGLTCLQQREGPLLLVWEEEDVWKPGGAEMGEAGWRNTWPFPGPPGAPCAVPALCPDLPPA